MPPDVGSASAALDPCPASRRGRPGNRGKAAATASEVYEPLARSPEEKQLWDQIL